MPCHTLNLSLQPRLALGLAQANLAVQRQLQASGHSCVLFTVPGTHAFHGLPPQWTLDWWRCNAYPATREMLRFLTDGDLLLPEHTQPAPFDWSLPLVLATHVVLPVYMVYCAASLWAQA